MEKYFEILENLKLYNPVNKKIRVGRVGDGGYVIIDGYKYDCFLTAGVADEVSFDIDFTKLHPNIPSTAFDMRVNKPSNMPQEILFLKTNIGLKDTKTTTNLKSYVKDYDNVFIKMDIEGEEWRWMANFGDSFKNVRQITIEGHALFPHLLPKRYTNCHCLGYNNDAWTDLILSGLQTINKTHYLVHMHQNIIGPFVKVGEYEYPAFAEFTFIRKDCLIDGLNKDDLPVKDLDSPCGRIPMPEGLLDRQMNYYPFKS